MQNQTKAYLFAFGTILCWSTVSTAFKIALLFLSPVQLITLSMFFASIFLGVYIVVSGEYKKFKQYGMLAKLYSLLPGCLIFIYYILLFLGYERLPAQIAQPINYSWALVLTILSIWAFKQRISLQEFCWLVVAYMGIVVISLGGVKHLGHIDSSGLVYIILSTFIYAIYWIVNTKSPLSNINQLFMSFLVSCILGIVFLAFSNQSFVFSKSTILPAVYIALFELSIPFILWGIAINKTQAIAKIASFPFLSPFLALFWVSLILKENIAPTTYVGLFLIIFGSYMQQRKR